MKQTAAVLVLDSRLWVNALGGHGTAIHPLPAMPEPEEERAFSVCQSVSQFSAEKHFGWTR